MVKQLDFAHAGRRLDQPGIGSVWRMRPITANQAGIGAPGLFFGKFCLSTLVQAA